MVVMRNVNDWNFLFCFLNFVVVVLILIVVWVSLYLGLLVGGDLFIVMDNLGCFVVYFFCGILCFFVVIYIIIFSFGILRCLRVVFGDYCWFVEFNVFV